MKKLVSLLLATAILTSLLASCGNNADTDSTASTNTNTDTSNAPALEATEVDLSAEPEGVVAGTTATYYSSADFVTLQLPGQFNNGQPLYMLVYDTLFYSPSGTWTDLEGLLVESYTLSDDGLVWVLNLHENVEFQNGNTLNAESVIGSFDFYLENGHGSSLNAVESYEATGEYQVTIVLSAASAEFMYLLSIPALSIFDHTMYQEYGYTVEAAYMAGSGPYYISDYGIGDCIVLSADEDHWNADRQAHIETVTMKVILNTTTQYNAIASCEVDFAATSDYSSYEMLIASEEHYILTSAGKSDTIWFNADNGFCEYLSNDRVREALVMMIDMEEAVMATTGGYGTVGLNPLTSYIDYEHDRVYDPDAALAILEEEGIAPSDITLVALCAADYSNIFTNIQSQFMDCGVTLTFVVQDQPAVVTAGRALSWDLWCEMGGLGTLPYYTSCISNAWSATAGVPVIQDADIEADVEAMVADAVSQIYIEDTYAIIADICEVLDTNHAYLINWSRTAWDVFTNHIQNGTTDKNNGGWRIWDSWIAE